jgi:hypothetical protein
MLAECDWALAMAPGDESGRLAAVPLVASAAAEQRQVVVISVSAAAQQPQVVATRKGLI